MRNPNPLLATTAFRVLGKFGGANRKMLKEPQTLHYKNMEYKKSATEYCGLQIHLKFGGTRSWAVLDIDDVISAAANCVTGSNEDDFYKIEGFQIIKSYILLLLKTASENVVSLGSEALVEKAKSWIPNKSVVYQTEFEKATRMSKSPVCKIMKDALVTLFYACIVDCVKEEAQLMTKQVVKRLAQLSIIRGIIHYQSSIKRIIISQLVVFSMGL